MALESTLLQEAQDPCTSAERLKQIYDSLPYSHRAASGSATAAAVAVHPNTPPNTLLSLTYEYGRDVLRNPALTRIYQASYYSLRKHNPDAFAALLRFENVPRALLQDFAEPPFFFDFLRSKPQMTEESARLHVGLAGESGPDWDAGTREAFKEASTQVDLVSAFPVRLLVLDLVPEWLLEWLLEALAAYPDSEIRWQAGRKAAACRFQSAPQQDLLPADPAERAQALSAAALQGDGSSFWENNLLERLVALACPDTPLKFLRMGADDRRWPCRLAVARNPAAFLLPLEMPGTESVLRMLARDGNRFVRAAARDTLQQTEGSV